MKPTALNLVAAIAALAVMGIATISMAGDDYWTEFTPGPAFMPFWIAGFGAVVALLLIVECVRGKWRAEERYDFSDLKPASVVIALLCVLLVILPWVGMLIGIAGLVMVILICLHRRPLAQSLIATTITTLLVYGVFDLWLHVSLPKGLLGF